MESELEGEEFSKKNEPVTIRSLLQKVITGKKWQSQLKMHQVFHFWNEIVGKDISERAQPSRIRGTVLWVDVTDSIWMQQLHLQKILILDLINKNLDGKGITDIRFQLNMQIQKEIPKPIQTSNIHQINTEKQKIFESHLTHIANDDVKQSLRILWEKAQKNL